MKKSLIEKMMLANRLRKKINEEKKITISNGIDTYNLTENEFKGLVTEAVNNVIKKKIKR